MLIRCIEDLEYNSVKLPPACVCIHIYIDKAYCCIDIDNKYNNVTISGKKTLHCDFLVKQFSLYVCVR